MLWNEAKPEERRVLLKSLIDLVYVDLETKRVTAIKPTPVFQALLGNAIETTPDMLVQLVPSVKQEKVGVGGDGGELNSPSNRDPCRIYYKLSRLFCLA
jgi:hypothetical protein